MGDQIKIDDWQLEKEEWLEAIEEVLEAHGKGRTSELLHAMRKVLARKGVANNGAALNTPYMNTISPDDQGAYPGDLELEQQLENIIRWNAGAMVLQAQAKKLALGGHIATYDVGGAFQPFLTQKIGYLRWRFIDDTRPCFAWDICSCGVGRTFVIAIYRRFSAGNHRRRLFLSASA
jgi:hypothetical protein